MRIALLLISCLSLSACVDDNVDPTEPEAKTQAGEASAAAQSAPADAESVAAEKTSTTAQNIPAACKIENAPQLPNGAPCSFTMYAKFHSKVCGEWRDKCCSFKGVCS